MFIQIEDVFVWMKDKFCYLTEVDYIFYNSESFLFVDDAHWYM